MDITQRLTNRTAELRKTFEVLGTSILKASHELESLKAQRATIQGALEMLGEVSQWTAPEQPEDVPVVKV